MSVVSDIGNVVTSIKNSIDSEVSKLGSDIGGAVTTFASEFSSELETIFNRIKSEGVDLKQDVTHDFNEFRQIIDDLGKKIETTADTFYNDFIRKSKAELAKVENTTSAAVNTVRNTTEYIRNGMRSDVENLLIKARTDFITIEQDFRQSIANRANTLISVTKTGISDIVGDAKTTLDDIDKLKNDIRNEIETLVDDAKIGLESFKNDIRDQLSTLYALVQELIEDLERRVEEVKNKAIEITERVAVVTFGVALVLSVALIIYNSNSKSRNDESN